MPTPRAVRKKKTYTAKCKCGQKFDNYLDAVHHTPDMCTPPRPPERKHHPLGCFDANEWAKEFCKITGFKDLDWARSWFASAIMTGHDEAINRNRSKIDLHAQLVAALEAIVKIHKSDLYDGEYTSAVARVLEKFQIEALLRETAK